MQRDISLGSVCPNTESLLVQNVCAKPTNPAVHRAEIIVSGLQCERAFESNRFEWEEQPM